MFKAATKTHQPQISMSTKNDYPLIKIKDVNKKVRFNHIFS